MRKVDVKLSAYGEKFLTFVFDDYIKDEEIESQLSSMIKYIDVDVEKTYDMTIEEYNEE